MKTSHFPEACWGCPVANGDNWKLFEDCAQKQACVARRLADWSLQIEVAADKTIGQVSVGDLMARAGSLS